MRLLSALILLLATATAALAAEEPRIIYKKRTVIDFSDDKIQGLFASPEVGIIDAERDRGRRSLIEERDSFRREILSSPLPR
jgi:hypothetical protein